MPHRPLLILGAGTFAVEVLEAAELSGREVRGFVVSDSSFRAARELEGRPVWTLDELSCAPAAAACVVGIVSTRRRALVEAISGKGFDFASVMHPSAVVSPRAILAAGSFVGARAIVSAHTRVGPHVILNRGANVAHDVEIGVFATVGPGAIIAGAVTMGERAWVGAGAVIRDHLAVGEGAVVAAGALVVKPVTARTLVAGVPAAVMREGVDGF